MTHVAGRASRAVSAATWLLLCAMVLFSAWAYGGAEPWAVYVLVLLAALLGIATVALPRRSLIRSSRFRSRSWLIPSAVLFVLLILQALNASHVFSPMGHGLDPRPHLRWLPASASASVTVRSALLYAAAGIVFFVTAHALDSSRQRRLVHVIIVSATAMAILSLCQPALRKPGDLAGRFLNANSFAAYINLVLPLALAAARTAHHRREGHHKSDPGGLLYFCAAILAVSVFLTGSRAGSIVCALSLSVWVGLEWLDLRNRPGRSQARKWVVWPVVTVGALLAILGADALIREFSQSGLRLGMQIEYRIASMRMALAMFRDRPLWGVGAGAFHVLSPYYADSSLIGFYRHAHCDWLQWLAELGLVGTGLGVVWIGATVRYRLGRGMARAIHFERALWIALAGVCLHAVIDFPFRIPAIILLVAVWLGLIVGRGSGGPRRRR